MLEMTGVHCILKSKAVGFNWSAQTALMVHVTHDRPFSDATPRGERDVHVHVYTMYNVCMH